VNGSPERPYRLAINGYGRIGRSVLRALYESGRRHALQVVAINEPADLNTMVHLTRYDSTHGRFPGRVSGCDGKLQIDDDAIATFHVDQVEALDWSSLGVDLVLECSGSFSSRCEAQRHLDRGAGAVLFSQPADPDVDATIVFGYNHQQIDVQQRILSAASCSTNAVVPVIDALDKAFGVQHGLITTIHSAMNDQPVIDAYHHTDLRKTRSAMHSIIPIETGLARGIDRVMPHLAHRFQAQAMRVPTMNVSVIDLSIALGQDVDEARVNAALRSASQANYSGVLGYTEEPLASCDFNHDQHSAIVDASQTRVAGGRLVKVLVWFDNEWGYANRMLDVAGRCRDRGVGLAVSPNKLS
jgi:glyceraldehyde 3-phosphate dehydrogenase/D-erythrose 4-phosphate dehydrogenase